MNFNAGKYLLKVNHQGRNEAGSILEAGDLSNVIRNRKPWKDDS
jgi:hypothetical protein